MPCPLSVIWQLLRLGGPNSFILAETVFDQRRGVLVQYGGLESSTLQSAAGHWEWDGTNWKFRDPGISPGPAVAHALAYDVARARVLLYSLFGASALSVVWEWDGDSWVRWEDDGSGPVSRAAPGFQYSSELGGSSRPIQPNPLSGIARPPSFAYTFSHTAISATSSFH